jgi:hypothetical protein
MWGVSMSIKSNTIKTRHAFEKLRDTATPALIKFAGVIGDGYGNVIVPHRTNYVYCQVNGVVQEIKNTKVSPVQGTTVTVGYSPDEPFILKVLDYRSTDISSVGTQTTIQGGSYAPASRYQWMAPGGGEDPLFVELRQMLYGRLSAGVSGSPMFIQIVRNIVNTSTGAAGWTMINNPTFNMAGYIPAQSGSGLAILVTANSSGSIVLTPGSVMSISSITIAAIPQPPTGTAQVYGAVRIYNGQTGIYEGRVNATDIVDLRFSGWGASSTSSSGGTMPIRRSWMGI